ncbi:MAG: M23 family metallopeptidase [Spirochaetales bacterium]|nr:M23 family metallopeptidase [Spirochaetales bacterium]
MSPRIVFSFFFLFLSFCATAETVIKCQEESSPGEIVRVTAVTSDIVNKISAELKNEKGILIKDFQGFRYKTDSIQGLSSESNTGLDCFIIIISFDPALRSGKYLLSVNIEGEYPEKRDFSVFLKERAYRKETISLNQNLSDLRTDDSERRKKETLELIGYLNTFNSENILADTNIMKPIMNNPVTTSFFGDIRNFIYKSGENVNSVHNGIDLAITPGTPVHCSASGRVIYCGSRLLTGNSVIIEHLPGLFTIYYHLEKIYVETDQFLSKGAVLGLVGSTGLSTGPHLHWEIRNQMTPVDPEYFTVNPLIDKDEILSIINSDFSDLAKGR